MSVGVFSAACEMIAGLSKTTQLDGDAAAALPDAGPTVDAGGMGLACSPKLPDVPVSAIGTDLDRFTFAVHFAGEGSAATASDAGLVDGERSRLCPRPDIDLDGLETCAKLPDGGRVGPSCLSLGSACDSAGGGDNVGGGAARLLLGDTPSAANDPNVAFRDGTTGILIEVTGYNGLDDDGDVKVASIFAVGVDDGSGKPGAKPKWDGTDTWIPEAASFVNDDLPTYVAASAFVADGLLVARFRGTPLSLGGATTTRLRAEEIVFTARIVRAGTPAVPVRLDYGRIAARVSLDTAFTYLGGRLSNGVPLCEPPNRKPIVATVCATADLLKTPGVVDPTAPCDAFSYALGFYAEIARRSARPSAQVFDASLPGHCPPDASWPPACSEVF